MKKSPTYRFPAIIVFALCGTLCSAEINWPNTPPSGCPFQQSDIFTGMTFTGVVDSFGKFGDVHADTWYPSWGSDNRLYSNYADGWVLGFGVNSGSQGWVIIQGDDPRHLILSSDLRGKVPMGVNSGYGGNYPSACLYHNNIWYYGYYTLDDGDNACGNWCVLGPFLGFWISRDQGQSWQAPPLGGAALFGESGKSGGKVKIGVPHVVDFGKNMEYSPDGKMYMVAHGTSYADGWANWIGGDQIYLLRGPADPDNVNRASSWEFFAGNDAQGKTVWTGDFTQIKPLIDWKKQVGNVSMTYFAPLKKYILAMSRPSDGFNSIGQYDSYFLESDSMTGPWKLVHYMTHFGEQAYFMFFPSKFVSSDGLSARLMFSRNFSGNVPGGFWPFNPDGGGILWTTLWEVRLNKNSAVTPVAAAAAHSPLVQTRSTLTAFDLCGRQAPSRTVEKKAGVRIYSHQKRVQLGVGR